MQLARARSRAAAYLQVHGARAVVTRKSADAWGTVHPDLPVMIEALSGGREILVDALEGTNDVPQGWRLSVEPGTDLQPGDRVETPAVSDTMTVVTVAETSLDVYLQATAIVERTAVETYTLTFERWSDATSAYETILTVEARVTTEEPRASSDTEGASGSLNSGVITITPPPDIAIGAGDFVLGIPWAPGATVSRVRPVVGNRLELEYQYHGGT